MGVKTFEQSCFLAQIKSSLYPAGVLCFVFFFSAAVSAPTWPSQIPRPRVLPVSPEFTLPGPAWMALLKPGSGALCWAGRAGGLSLSPKEQNASLSLYLSVSLSVRVCVSLAPLCLCSMRAPCGRFPPPAHPESRSLAVLAPLQDVDVGAGEMALFECLVAGPADVEVDWLSRGRLLQPALLKCKMHFDGRKCKLLLTSVHEDDSGVYTCKLSTAKGNGPLGPWGCRPPPPPRASGWGLEGWEQGS